MKDLLERPARAAADRPRIDPRIAQRWVEARRQEGRRRLRVLVGVAAVAAVVALAAGLLYSPLFAVKHVRVSITGAPGVSVARVEAEGGLAHHPLMMDLNTAAVTRRLDADPLLGAARVAKHWPATVTVSVVVRTPLAQVPAAPTGSSLYVPVDATGRVLGPAASRASGLPVVTGVGTPPAPGGWLAGSAGPGVSPAPGSAAVADMTAASDAADVPRGVAGALAFLQALPASLRAGVTSVGAGPGPAISVVVAPPRSPQGTLTVQLGDGSQLAAKVTALETLLDQADLSGVTSIDLSVPTRPAATLSQPSSTGSASSSSQASPAAGQGSQPAAASATGVPTGSASSASQPAGRAGKG